MRSSYEVITLGVLGSDARAGDVVRATGATRPPVVVPESSVSGPVVVAVVLGGVLAGAVGYWALSRYG